MVCRLVDVRTGKFTHELQSTISSTGNLSIHSCLNAVVTWMSVGFSSLSVCPRHNSKTNDPKVFKLGVGNDLEISHK